MKPTYTDVQIPLNKLVVHPRNVRSGSQTAYSEDSIKPLAANIAEHGLLQPLIVQQLEDGIYGVVGGGRRLIALTMLAADKSAKGFTKAMKVSCREMDAGETAVTSVSYSENALQLPMDMIERYEAFAAMQETDGADIATIARAFTITERTVKEAMRLGNIHPEIRAAHKDGSLSLDALKAFDRHPDPEVQLETYHALKQENPNVMSWRVREAFTNRFVRAGDALGAFVLDAYREAGGDIIQDLIDEDSILSDDVLINKLLNTGLSDIAEQKREELGFAWSEARSDVEWDTFNGYERIYPKPIEIDEATQKEADALVEQMDKVAAECEAAEEADDFDEIERLDTLHEEIRLKHEALTEGFTADELASAGVIAYWQHGEARLHIGMIRPEDQQTQEDETAAPEGSAPSASPDANDEDSMKVSAKLADDMAHIRTRAVGLALAQSPDLARDYIEFMLISKVIGGAGARDRYSTTLSASKASRGPDAPEGSLLQIEEAFETLQSDLATDWLGLNELDSFIAFRELAPDQRSALLAFAVAQMLEPRTTFGLRDPVREAVEREAMPNIRDIWTPDESFLGRLVKPDLLKVLRKVGLKSEASVYADGKKSKLVDYMTKLFAEPFATLTDDQREAVTGWAPGMMQHEHTVVEDQDDHEAEDVEPETALMAAE